MECHEQVEEAGPLAQGMGRTLLQPQLSKGTPPPAPRPSRPPPPPPTDPDLLVGLLVVWPSYVQCQSCAASSPVIWACSTVSPDNKVDTRAPNCLQDESEGGPFKGHMKTKVVYSENAAPSEVFSGMAPVCDEQALIFSNGHCGCASNHLKFPAGLRSQQQALGGR